MSNLLTDAKGNKIIERAIEERKLADDHVQMVYDSLDPKYHKFVRLLSQKKLLWNEQFDLSYEQKSEYHLASYKEKTFVEVFQPYFNVEGKLTMMMDVHREKGAGYKIEPKEKLINHIWTMEVTFEGLNKDGLSVKTTGHASIGFGGNGVDATNPIENAETSAIGRALGQAGYGNIGSGLSSIEEIMIARSREEQLPEDKKQHHYAQHQSSNPKGEPTPNESFTNQRSTSASTNQQRKQDKRALVGRILKLKEELGYENKLFIKVVSGWLDNTFNGVVNSLEESELLRVEESLLAVKEKMKKKNEAS